MWRCRRLVGAITRPRAARVAPPAVTRRQRSATRVSSVLGRTSADAAAVHRRASHLDQRHATFGVRRPWQPWYDSARLFHLGACARRTGLTSCQTLKGWQGISGRGKYHSAATKGIYRWFMRQSSVPRPHHNLDGARVAGGGDKRLVRLRQREAVRDERLEGGLNSRHFLRNYSQQGSVCTLRSMRPLLTSASACG